MDPHPPDSSSARSIQRCFDAVRLPRDCHQTQSRHTGATVCDVPVVRPETPGEAIRGRSSPRPQVYDRAMHASPSIAAVVFDMDGVLVDTEHLWDDVREELTNEWGGRYTPAAQEAMMGMSSHEWSRYLHEVVGLREQPETINAEVVRRMLARDEAELPGVRGAVDAVRRLHAEGLRLAVASSSNRELIDAVLRRLELTD